MFSCKFLISNSLLNDLNNLVEYLEISNVSIFEDVSRGFSEELDDCGFPIANFFNVEILTEDLEEAEQLEKELQNKFQDQVIDFKIDTLNNQDWIELYTKELTPVLCDKFYFYNEEIQSETDDSSLIPIKLNSALAFGSGHHQTTKGCLLNLVFLDDMGLRAENILDMGCGTGILGICAKKLWKDSRLQGIDIDNDAVEITKSNYEANEIEAEARQGFNVDSLISSGEKFDLILCNILKQPLIDLCNSFSKTMSENSHIITSGYIKNQEQEVIDCYQRHNFKIANRIYIEDWCSIMFRKK